MSLSGCSRIISRAFLKKRRNVCLAEMDLSKLERSYNLFDLLCVGIGGTVGSGVFVLTGLIARNYTGPGILWSWIIAGFGCCFSAMSYAELSSRIPSDGSSYTYVYIALGELPAVLSAWCLSLEYGISGAAVARSWGDKVISYIRATNGPQFIISIFNPVQGVNLFAGLLQFLSVVVLLMGIDIGKITVNSFTVLKMVLVAFMIIAGMSLFKTENLAGGWAPFGLSGILRGATSCFFGYVGYDEVCCLAGEAKDPNKTLPLAVFGTIASVTVMYCLASVALIGMQDYRLIDPDSGFSEAFRANGYDVVHHIVASGEIVTLPLVVLVSFLAQPRLLYAMGDDGLLPKLFTEVNSNGNLFKGIVVSGTICTSIAIFIPFYYLDDMISAGVLVSFTLTNCSLIILRRGGDTVEGDGQCGVYIASLNAFCIAFACTVSSSSYSLINNITPEGVLLSLFFLLGIIASVYLIHYRCPEVPDVDPQSQYRVPWVPFTPSFGIIVNYVLLAQLSPVGLSMIAGYFALACLFYFGYGIHHSKGNNTGWREVLRESQLHRGSDSTEGDDLERERERGERVASYHRLSNDAPSIPSAAGKYVVAGLTSSSSVFDDHNEQQEDGAGGYKSAGVVRNVISVNGPKYLTLINHDSGKR